MSFFRFISFAAAGIVAISWISSCSDDGNNNNKYLIDVAPRDALHFEAEGPFKTEKLSVSSTWPQGYKVEVTPDNWLTINSDENTVEIVPAGNNKSKEDIKGTVKIYIPDGPFVEIDVTQDGFKEYSYSWDLVWSEEFDGPVLDTDTWNIETGGSGWGNQELQYYTDRGENLRIEDGQLIIQARRESQGTRNYTSARINTMGKAEFTYGRIEARISFPSGGGTWGAFWMMGTNYSTSGWPLCGEIDIIEKVGNNPRGLINAVHTSVANGNNGLNWSSRTSFDNVEDQFHVYAIEWYEDYRDGYDCIEFYFDENLTGRCWQSGEVNQRRWPFDKPFFILLNLAIGGNLGGNVDNSIFDNDVLMKVDYVRVYERVATEIN